MRFCVLAALLILGGCWQSESRSAYRVTGTAAGQPVELTAQGATASDAGMDPVAALAGAIAALRGDVVGMREAVKAQPPPQPPIPAAEIAQAVVQATPPPPPPPSNAPLLATGGTALAALVTALLQARSAAAGHKADADEAWNRLLPPPAKA